MFKFVEVSFLEKSIQSLWLIGIILLVRRYFNLKSTKYANKILWIILFINLLIPYSIFPDIQGYIGNPTIEAILKPFILINDFAKLVTVEFGETLSRINRVLVSSLILIYTIYKFYKINKGLKGSKLVKEDIKIEKYIKLFKFKRKVQVLINDNIKVPVTYGLIKPKIIIQSHVLKDDEMLKYVLIHELTHIQRFDMVFTHIKNLITCIYWYNLFVLVASKYMEDDIEVLCDKLVIQKVGDTLKARKEYCVSMLNLIEEKEKHVRFALNLNPTQERMIIMRKWKKSLMGVISFVAVVAISTTVFADVSKLEEKIIVSDETLTTEDNISSKQIPAITYKEEIKIITDEEYNTLKLGDSLLQTKLQPLSANIDKSETLSGLSNNQYSFDMKSWTEANHNAFAIKISNMSCSSGVDYQVIIQRNGDVIYRNYFTSEKNITIENAHNNSKYNVIILNQSTDSLKYKININSYIKL